MTSIVKKTLGYAVADTILNDIRSNRSKYYYFIGKSIPEISNQYAFADTAGFEMQTRNEMTFLRRVPLTDVSLVIPRVNWEPNKVFQMYEALSENSAYYCMNSQYNVYKCLDNNRGQASQVEPISITSDSFILADGYRWKFLYNIPLALRNKFLTFEYIPVIKSLNSRYYSNGSIQYINIINPGSGYTEQTTTVVINGNGVGADVTPIIQNGQLVDIIINNPGYGYTFANIEIESTRFEVIPAIATVDLSIGDINSPQSLVEMLAIAGSIDSVSVSAAGSGYTYASASITGDGTGASAVVVLSGGLVRAVNIVQPGSGYTSAVVNIFGDGVGAKAIPNISPLFGHGRNSPEELNASSIMIYQNFLQQRFGNIYIENDFSQYGLIRNPLTLDYGTNITSTIDADSYSVICNFSPGTTIANFAAGLDVYVLRSGVQKMFRITAILSGVSGKGMVLEGTETEILKDDLVMLAADPAKSFTVITSEYRKITQTNSLNCSYIVDTNISDISPYTVDTVLTNADDAEFRIIAVDQLTTRMLLLPLANKKIVAQAVLNIKGSINSFIVTSVISPDIDRRTGDILFVENRSPYNQTTDQSVTFRTVLNF
jgi:hypothetical protein